MRTLFYQLFFSCIVTGIFSQYAFCFPKQEDKAIIIPQPVSSVVEEGYFTFCENTVIAVENDEQFQIASAFASLFTQSAGFTPKVKRHPDGSVRLISDVKMKDEAYELRVAPRGITIKASSPKGFFYALQSVRLLLPPAIEEKHLAHEVWRIPAIHIQDEPRFGYRGFMLDVARYFLPKEELLRMIDCISMLKINTLHLHLSDDNGWRIEIKKYPRLTEIGAWRVDRESIPFPARLNQCPGENTPVGGYYTQEDMREIIDYAAKRQIEVIPEIDIPAHSNAALASYPEYVCPVVKQDVTVIPGMGGANSRIIFCAGNEKVYGFLQDILDEIMDIFPSRYIHLGGDEANKEYWNKCPLCQERIRKEHLDNSEALQGYFMQRMSAYVQSRGREVIGWDELTNSRIPDKAIIMGWQGYGKAALKAAEQGHRFIMTPARVAYLIRYQGPQWFEPLTYFGNNTMKDLFCYEPVQPEWKPMYESLLMGVQGCLWTEFCTKPADVFYLAFPRLAALAEIGWVQKGEKNWDLFLKGLDNYNAHISRKKVEYARSMFNIQHKVNIQRGKLLAELACERPDVEIRYTLDNTEPDMFSPLYNTPIELSCNGVIKAATFKENKQMGETLMLPLQWNLATAKPVVESLPGTYLLTNGLRGSLRESDFEWYTISSSKTSSFTLDLQSDFLLDHCIIGCLTNYSMAVHKPRSVEIEVSTDNQSYVPVGKLEYSDKEIFVEGNFVQSLRMELKNVRARYVRFNIELPGNCPQNHVRPGQASRVCIDEIIIK